jgi:predicted dehydrogenase
VAKERALVVGAGGISGAWFPPLMAEKVNVVGVVDLKKSMAQSRIKEYGLDALASTDLEAAIKKTQPDFVIDLTVPDAHCTVTCTALAAGCHVIGEKPMANSMPEARRMVRAAEKAKKLYRVSQSRRWEPKHDALQKTIAKGEVGRMTTANCDFYIGAHFGGFRDVMPSPLILDMSIHHFDLIRYMTGTDPVAVYAKEFNPKGSWYKNEVAASCIFEMTKGVIFTYRGSWCAEGCSTSWHGDWRFIGDKGTLLYEGDQDPTGQIVKGKVKGFSAPMRMANVAKSSMKYTGMHGALREMLTFLRTRKKPQCECHDDIKSLAMVFAAIESSNKGRRVPGRAM